MTLPAKCKFKNKSNDLNFKCKLYKSRRWSIADDRVREVSKDFVKLFRLQFLLEEYDDLNPFKPVLILVTLVISSVHAKHFARDTWKQTQGF